MGPLRSTSVVEATTYLALVVGVIVHRLLDGPDLVSVLGPIHGVAFLAYLAAVLRARGERRWDTVQTVTLLFAAVVPLGGYVVARRLDDGATGPLTVPGRRPSPR
ncbi:MAG: DUF3817 domain-containing protein [Acidimicrobiales bacterium]